MPALQSIVDRKWTQAEESFLLAHYATLTMEELAQHLGRSKDQVRGKKERLGNLNKHNDQNKWTAEQLAILKQYYAVAGETADLNLPKISELVGKLPSNVSRKARELGLTNSSRSSVKVKQYTLPLNHRNPNPNKGVPIWNNRSHPKGMLGKKHTPENREIMLTNLKLPKPPMSQQQRNTLSRIAVERMRGENAYSRTVKGWVEIGEKRIFCKSKWEMNYANYMEFLKKAKQIQDWEYEPDTFWFEKIRRGVRSYTPDFRILNNDNSIEYHEVKGWMDQKSKTKIKRMGIYYPKIKLIVIAQPEYMTLKRQLPRVFTY